MAASSGYNASDVPVPQDSSSPIACVHLFNETNKTKTTLKRTKTKLKRKRIQETPQFQEGLYYIRGDVEGKWTQAFAEAFDNMRVKASWKQLLSSSCIASR